MLTLDEVKQELGIDYNDHDQRLQRYIKLANEWLSGAVDQFKKDDERAKQLALLVIEELYDRPSNSSKENAMISRLKNDFLMQLQYESETEDGNV